MSEKWYFDSGCSKHMTGNKHYLEDISPCPTCFVTFGDGGRGQIKGIGKIRFSKYPNLVCERTHI